MAEIQGEQAEELRKNFFITVQHNFPDLVNGKINTTDFLQASKDVVVLIDKFGKVFSPITYDLTKNIEKITLRYQMDNQKFEDLQDMILVEKEGDGNLITDALLWLRRGIHMMYLFFRAINDDFYEGKKTEDLAPFLRKAYEKTLEPFHGWMAQQLFSILSRFCPTRTNLMVILAVGEEIHDESVMHSMREFLDKLQTNVDELVHFYAQNNLESTAKSGPNWAQVVTPEIGSITLAPTGSIWNPNFKCHINQNPNLQKAITLDINQNHNGLNFQSLEDTSDFFMASESEDFALLATLINQLLN